MKIFWVYVNVIFKEHIPVFEANSNNVQNFADGFFQEIGCTADNEDELKNYISVRIKKNIDWDKVNIHYERIGVIAKKDVESEVYNDLEICDCLESDPNVKGIWYSSGKAFYTDE